MNSQFGMVLLTDLGIFMSYLPVIFMIASVANELYLFASVQVI